MTTLKQCQNNEEWDDFVLENGGNPLQLWGWGELKTSHGWSADRLFLINSEEQIIGATQILVRHLPWPLKSLSYIPRGPIVKPDNREELLSSLSNYVKKTYKPVALTIEPDEVEYNIPKEWVKSKNHILPFRTVILDLNKDEPELMSDMAKKTRQYIRKSTSEEMVIKSVRKREELDKCLAIYHDTAKRAKFALHDDQYYYDAFEKLGDHSQLFATYVDNQPVAFLWLVISAETSYELYGGMNEIGQQTRANYALKWHAIRKCKEWGLSRYDFGGLLDGGVTTFKMGWTNDETDLVGTFDRPLSVFYGVWNNCLPLGKKIVRRIKALFK